ncbi:MAG TPA: serine/threonine-protein kinase [Kofleriaceae bacterium]|nr:serine/threonine-protein kinase [Kofleriaceae bacterium]
MVGPDPHLGTVLHGRYLVCERVAEGAMAVVYRGERVGLKRQVAIKFLHESYASSEDGMRRFEVEARAMSRLAHPNCVAVTDFGLDNGAPYLVMEFVTGSSLRDVLEDEIRIRPPRAVAIVKQVLAGLTHSHGQGIVHRDMKPENIILSSVEGHGEQIRILDFGLAKLRDENSVTSGLAVGTPGYMAPEQTVGEKVDERADLYATGIILFELMAGRKPFQAESPFDVMRMHREAPVPPLAAAAPGVSISPELESVVRHALAKSRSERFATAGAFLEALESTPEAEGSQVMHARAPRHGRIVAAVGAALALAVGSAAGVFWLLTRESENAGASESRPAVREPPNSAGPVTSSQAPPADQQPTPTPAPAAETPGPAPAPEPELPDEPADVARLRSRAAAGDQRGAVRALERMRSREPRRPAVYYALGNLYAELNAWRPSVESYAGALRLQPAYRRDPRLINDVVEALASDMAHSHAARIIRKELGKGALPRLEQAMRSASPRQRVRAKRLRARIAR